MISIKVKDPLFTYHARIVNIEHIELEHIYYVKYNNNSFCLVIDNLKGYFKYSKEKYRKRLKFIIEDQRQAKIYNQIWDKIKELINSVDGVNFGFSDSCRDHGVIRFDTDDTLPLDDMVSVYSMTIVIRSVCKTYYDRFYPQIHLTNCIYKTC